MQNNCCHYLTLRSYVQNTLYTIFLEPLVCILKYFTHVCLMQSNGFCHPFHCLGEVKVHMYSKTCVKQPPSKRPKIGFQDQLSLNAGQKYYRMFQGEYSAILSTFIKVTFVIMIFVLSIFECQFYTGFTILDLCLLHISSAPFLILKIFHTYAVIGDGQWSQQVQNVCPHIF